MDIGIKESGLLHISQISDTFVKDPLSVLKVGQEVKAQVLDVDYERKRISLSCKKGKGDHNYAEYSSSNVKNSGNKSKKRTQDPTPKSPFSALKNFKVKPDIVLGNNFGKSSSENLISYIKNDFEKFGLKVEINNPYAGGFITRKYGNPLTGIETVQIEINRSLYMDETRHRLNDIHYLQKIFSEIFNNFEYSFRLAAE